MPQVITQQCPNCGARIPLQKNVSDVRCEYCGNMIHVEWTKKVPPPGTAQPLTVYVKPPTAGPILWIVALGAIVPLVIGGVIAAAATSASVSGVPGVPGLGGKITDVTFPATCGLNQEMEIVDRTFEGSGTLITGEVNCKIKIKNSTLKGDVVVLAKNLVELTLENSTIEGKEAAVKVEMNSKIFATQKSVIKGGEAGILAKLNTDVSLTDSKVEGQTAISAETNFELEGTSSEVVGKDYGLQASSNAKVKGKKLVVRGGRAAIESEHNLELELRGGSVEGGEVGVKSKGSNAKIKLREDAKITGKEAGIDASNNLALEMEQAVVEGGEVGISAAVNPKLRLGPKSRVHGRDVALKMGINFELDMRGATVESPSVAICAPFNVEISARDSTIKGAEALRLERKPRTLELEGTRVEGQQNFKGRGCRGR